MLSKLKIKNFLLIASLEIDFKQGLTVVTGETGSGKSIIIDALMLIFGARANTNTIRHEAQQAVFEAEFNLSNQNAITWLADNDLIDKDDNQLLICRRIIDESGKSRGYINGSLANIAQLKQLGEYILDIHTQHASITLLQTDTQRKLIDEYARLYLDIEKLATLYSKIEELKTKIKEALLNQNSLQIKIKDLNELITDLTSLELKPDEWYELEIQHKQLINANMILQQLNSVDNLLVDKEGIINAIHKLQTKMDKIIPFVPKCNEVNSILNSVDVELQEMSYTINTIARNIEEDPEKLQIIEDRIEQIFAVSRKYKITPEQIIAKLESSEQELLSINNNCDTVTLEKELTITTTKYVTLATTISKSRQDAAKKLSTKITKLLQKLAINGEFEVQLVPQQTYRAYGLENIEYLVSFNKGMQLQSLAKVASGGELSRTALALYLTLSMVNSPEIIIFDEIDVAIGGKVAATIGKMLYELSQHIQVVCITHQPQTASFGNNHLVVNKTLIDNKTTLNINIVENVARIDEIARMLGGMEITPTTINHAAEMLNISQGKYG